MVDVNEWLRKCTHICMLMVDVIEWLRKCTRICIDTSIRTDNYDVPDM